MIDESISTTIVDLYNNKKNIRTISDELNLCPLDVRYHLSLNGIDARYHISFNDSDQQFINICDKIKLLYDKNLAMVEIEEITHLNRQVCSKIVNYLGLTTDKRTRKLKSRNRYKGLNTLSGKLFGRLKRGAKSRDLEFLVSIEYLWDLYLSQDKRCALSGVEIELIECEKFFTEMQTASLDRIDSSKGYIEGNVQWVHKCLNRLKSNTDNSLFINLCCSVANHRNMLYNG